MKTYLKIQKNGFVEVSTYFDHYGSDSLISLTSLSYNSISSIKFIPGEYKSSNTMIIETNNKDSFIITHDVGLNTYNELLTALSQKNGGEK